MELTKYHYRFTRCDLHPVCFDSGGIPHVHLPGVRQMCHPVTVANWGLHLLFCYGETGQPDQLVHATRLAEWLMANQEDGMWLVPMSSRFYGIEARWVSAMVQGQAIAFLSRMAKLCGRPAFQEVARRALRPFNLAVTDGGVLARTEWGDFYEEYPSIPPSLVLNGFIFALFGLHDLAELYAVTRARRLYEQGRACLERIIDQYDTGYWTRYDLFPRFRLASQEYHKLHIHLVLAVGRLARMPRLADRAARWQTYRNSLTCQIRWLAGKTCEKLTSGPSRASLWLRVK